MLYFSDVTDDGEPNAPDGLGTEFSDRKFIPNEAVALIANIARDRLPGGQHRTFGVSVREDQGPVIFKATLTLKAEWQRG